MSGGDFNYLYGKTFFEMMVEFDYHDEEDDLDEDGNLKEMIQILKNYGYNDIADNIQKIVDDAIILEERINKYKDLFKAVEWHTSGDWGKDRVIEEVENLES